MITRFCLLMVLSVGTASLARAQSTPPAPSAPTANPLSTEAQQAYATIKGNLVKMADKMPDEHYAFKPSPDIRSFGQLVAHVADAQASMCSLVNGQTKAVNAAAKSTKPDLVAALKDSFALCDTAYGALNDTRGTEMVKTGRGDRTKMGVLAFNTAHSNEEYGYMSVYLRLKGIVPPSSEPR